MYTSTSLRKWVYSPNTEELTRGSSADFGFDLVLYTLSNKKNPSVEQLENLRQKYKEIFENGITDIELYYKVRDKEVRKMLGTEFDLVVLFTDFC